MNTIVVSGRSVRDLEVRNVGDYKVAKFTIAVWRAGNKQEDGTYKDGFFDVEAWNKTAERLEKTLKKGGQVTVQGSLRQHIYESEGVKKYSTFIVADNVEIPFEKDSSGAPANAPATPAPVANPVDVDDPWS